MKYRKIIITVVAVIVVIALAYPKIKKSVTAPKTDNTKKGQAMPSIVTAYVAKPEKIAQLVQSSGTLLAFDEVDLHSEIAGKITGIYFREGSSVKKGDLLVKMFDKDLQAQLKKLELQKDLNEKTEWRQKQLLAVKGISQEEYDKTLNLLDVCKADIELIKAQLQKTEIRAPFAGTIGLKSVSEGAYIISQNTIASLQKTDSLKIDFSIPEKYMSDVKEKMPLTFSIQGISTKFNANIYAIEPKIDVTTRTLELRAAYVNNGKKLLPGAFALIELSLNQIEDALLIPTQAIIPEAKGQKIYVSNKGKAQVRKVEIGIRTDERIQITKGIEAGDTVIITGIMQLRPDAVLKIIKVIG